MTYREFQHFVYADLFRYDRATGWKSMLRTLWIDPGFRFIWLLRACRYLRSQPWSRWGVYHFFEFWRKRIGKTLGVYVDLTTEIGPGFYMPHPCGIIINRRCRIGKNCNVSQHVTLGLKSREPRAGCPVIGDRVFIGPGAVIIGSIMVGADAALGANCVVTKDVPPHAVVVGVPGTIVSMRGSEGYINDCLP